MKACPICRFDKVGTALRCPKCRATLTQWINFSQHAHQAYRAGLGCLQAGDRSGAVEWLTHAVTLDPEEPLYASALGRIFGQMGRYAEAEFFLERAVERQPLEAWVVAHGKAKQLAKAAPEAVPTAVPVAVEAEPIDGANSEPNPE